MRSKFYIFLLLPLILLADERLRLVRADLLENIVNNGTAVQVLTGNVVFEKGDLILSCEKANYTQRTGQGYLIGNAKAEQDSNYITADTLHFDSPNDLLIATGNAHAWDNKYDITAKSIIYYTEIDSGMARGNANLRQNNQEIIADELIYSNPVKKEGANYTAIGNVSINSDDRIITCGLAKYDIESEIAQLTESPKVNSDEEIISGDTLVAHFNEEVLQYLFIPSNAKAYSIHKNETLGEYRDDMTGNLLKAYFVDGMLDSMRIEGMATTLYHVFNDSIYQGINTTSGDTITLQFDNQELQKIYIAGGARGTYAPDTSNSNLDDEIKYSAKDIDYLISDETTRLLGNAQVDYTDLTLAAGYIGVNWQTNILDALPIAQGDTTSREITPTLKDGKQEPLLGEAMTYNLQNERGKITQGKTKADDGHYYSQDIRNESQDVFYMKRSIYTTCELEDNPHFHFASPKMKMINNDKVIAKPLTLYIAQIPILALPFAMLPMQEGGRQSGWIMPSYGTSSLRGHYLDGIGYYWAINDYFDTKLSASFADLQGLILKSTNRYKVRYKYSGNLQLETRQYLPSGLNTKDKNIFDIFGPRQKDYLFRWTHAQEMRKNQSFNVSASYLSNSDYNYLTSLDPNKRMNQQAISNATYSKRWPKSNNSISINLSSNTDLMADRKIVEGSSFYQTPLRAGTQLGITSQTLPKISFRHGQRPLFPTKSSDKSWYNNITWNYSSNFNNKNSKYYESIESNTEGEFIWDADSDGGKVFSKSDKLLSHSFSFGAPQKIFRYISLNPSVSIKSDWVDRYYEAKLDTNNAYQSVEKSGFATRTTGSFNMNLGTQLYGLFPIKFGKVNGLRHVASPSIGYSFTPDFSQSLLGYDFGYYSTIIDSSNEEISHDKFSGTSAGSTPRSERQSLNFSLNNVFQTKFGEGESAKKIDLLSWRVSSNYNFAKDEFNLSNLRSSIRTGLSKTLKLDISMTHDFYEFDSDNNTRINNIRTTNNIPIPRLINARLGTGFTFSGKRLKSFETADADVETDSTTINKLDDFGQNNRIKDSPRSLSGSQLWSTNINFSYAYNAANPTNISKTFWMNTNTTIQATPNWRVQHSARFDLVNQSMVSQSFSIYRNIHCWEMSISWTPGGYGQGLYLRINVKSPTLNDLKLEQRGGVIRNRPNF